MLLNFMNKQISCLQGCLSLRLQEKESDVNEGKQGETGRGRGNLWFLSHVPHQAGLIWVRLPVWGSWVRRADGATVRPGSMGFLVSPLFPPFSPPSEAYIGFWERNKGHILCP